ncbi:YpjP family protein [Neobacillus cucumis]|uniref:YpjP family protein n=1 Tax=Neobacillus cucumis TaxID=1740721 RepID=UPI00285302D9|nr:YpjP family protein [Neobacillus cucumis]MDR4948316.1 YpjP family protein [Neobacillus cucumis]
MNKWLRKSLFVTISILTFGLVTPTQLMNQANANKITERDGVETAAPERNYVHSNNYVVESEFNREEFIQGLIKKAEIQSYQKFGTRIKPVIENEFREIILPNIERALEETATQFPESEVKNLTITEQPGAGLSEKIFNIKDSVSGKDILRFHVRRDNPPQEGYWFNFHYHTYHDQFHTHYELGSIYWAKNTPPKWMS